MNVEDLGPGARAERYREMARAQMELAATRADPETQAVCLELAAMWTRLAEAAERQRTLPQETRRGDRASA